MNTLGTVQSVFKVYVLSDFSDGKCPICFAVKRTNVLSVLSHSGHLSYKYPSGCAPLCRVENKSSLSSITIVK